MAGSSQALSLTTAYSSFLPTPPLKVPRGFSTHIMGSGALKTPFLFQAPASQGLFLIHSLPQLSCLKVDKTPGCRKLTLFRGPRECPGLDARMKMLAPDMAGIEQMTVSNTVPKVMELHSKGEDCSFLCSLREGPLALTERAFSPAGLLRAFHM